ncbi:MAG TPA: hypothetical protein VM287_10765 [Egibacteraceae bacterium]|nr:hypothetical protein [Egibacteraceae bacterium]
MRPSSPGPRELFGTIWKAVAVGGFLAGLAATTVGGSAVATLTLSGPPQPFAPIASLAGVAAGAADAVAVSVAVALPDGWGRAEPAASRTEGPMALAHPQVFATAAGVPLVTPSDQTRVVGFHQAGSGAALPLEPQGTPFTNRNVPRYTPLPPSEGPDYAVMANRRRSTHPASAVDVAVPHNVTLTSPVSGTVDTVTPYLLYGRHPDLIITVVPEGRPELRLVIIHVNGALVAPGQRLVAGETPIARTAMPFPFSSQIDEWAGQGPHMHLEMRRVG